MKLTENENADKMIGTDVSKIEEYNDESTVVTKSKIRVYLDNCCYSRPYDDQCSERIVRETKAKLKIQHLIVNGKVELVASYFSLYECNNDRDKEKAAYIIEFINKHTRIFVGNTYIDEIKSEILPLMEANIKYYDASHIVASIKGKVDYFITVDDDLIKGFRRMDRYNPELSYGIKVIKPDEFPFEC